MVWFDGQLHEDQNDYYGYYSSCDSEEINTLYDSTEVQSDHGKVLLSDGVIKEYGLKYYVLCCIGFAVRSKKFQYECKTKKYYVYNNPQDSKWSFADEASAKEKYKSLASPNKCLLYQGTFLLREGENYQDSWLGQWVVDTQIE